jgi:hypothetical protein
MTPNELAAYRAKSAVQRKNFSAIKSPHRRCVKCKLSKPVKGFKANVCADCQPPKEESDE